MSQALNIGLFDFALPAEQIAQHAVEPRDSSRLLVHRRDGGGIAHSVFHRLPQYLRAGDLLIVNRTRVIPARLWVQKPTGGRVELLCFRAVGGDIENATQWEVLGRPGSALQPGKELIGPAGDRLRVVERRGDTAIIESAEPLMRLLRAAGRLPLPPYIERPEGPSAEDDARYQSIFADVPGAVAAPTASLHFTPNVMAQLAAQGVNVASLVLQVGPGTFLPIRSEHYEDVRGHAMHSEPYQIPSETLAAIAATKAAGGRVIAVGTTAARALETWGKSGQATGESTLFIYPGYEFSVVDGLVTNFHLPCSTLLMLVSAFAGREAMLQSYQTAVNEGYRFFSYGDAMLIL